jgi:Anp1
MFNAQVAPHLDGYFERLAEYDYPKKDMSLGFLVSDSDDGTVAKLKEHLAKASNLYKSVSFI